MRIGLVGGMANAMYCFTRVLRQLGYDAYYVEDPQDLFPMSQPLWEEMPLTMEWRRFGSQPPHVEEWQALARECGWHAPDWILRPTAGVIQPSTSARIRLAFRVGPRSARTLNWYLSGALPMVDLLASFDRLVVCGVRIAEAFLSGRPYVFWPHGGDVHIVPSQRDTPYDRAFSQLMRAAIAGAELAGSHDPTIAARLEEFGRPAPIPYLPFVVDIDRYAPGEPTTAFAQNVRSIAGDRRILLLASRQDFFWKGTDRFARAFASTVAAGAPLYLVVSPWGADYEATRQIFAEAGVLDAVHYLDSAVSKPLLRDLFRVADIVVDQFTVTAFGALMLEAMACGTPVLINLDLAAFRSRWPDFSPPPTISAATEEEIAAVLRGIADGSVDLARLGKAARDWIEAHHGPETARLYVGYAS